MKITANYSGVNIKGKNNSGNKNITTQSNQLNFKGGNDGGMGVALAGIFGFFILLATCLITPNNPKDNEKESNKFTSPKTESVPPASEPIKKVTNLNKIKTHLRDAILNGQDTALKNNKADSIIKSPLIDTVLLKGQDSALKQKVVDSIANSLKY